MTNLLLNLLTNHFILSYFQTSQCILYVDTYKDGDFFPNSMQSYGVQF